MWKLKSAPFHSTQLTELLKHGWEPFAALHDGTSTTIMLRKYDSGMGM